MSADRAVMKVVIVEDEQPAARHLQRALLRYDASIEVVAVLDGVEAAVAWLAREGEPDVLFCDIELSDGLALRIFEQVAVRCPIIFCTAYDQYWLEAFAAGGIDYVLKPVEQARLNIALDKVCNLRAHFTSRSGAGAPAATEPAAAAVTPAKIQRLLAQLEERDVPAWRKNLLVKRGLDHVAIAVEEVAYFTTEHKLVIMADLAGEQYLLDGSLATIAAMLDPAMFFRANRRFLVAFRAVEGFRLREKGRLQVKVRCAPEPITVSQERARLFREWMQR